MANDASGQPRTTVAPLRRLLWFGLGASAMGLVNLITANSPETVAQHLYAWWSAISHG